MRQNVKPHSKTLNILGLAYKNAKPANQLKYKAALLEAGETDKTNYWRSFRDVWQYAGAIGKAPFMIVVLADEILDYDNQPKPELAK